MAVSAVSGDDASVEITSFTCFLPVLELLSMELLVLVYLCNNSDYLDSVVRASAQGFFLNDFYWEATRLYTEAYCSLCFISLSHTHTHINTHNDKPIFYQISARTNKIYWDSNPHWHCWGRKYYPKITKTLILITSNVIKKKREH